MSGESVEPLGRSLDGGGGGKIPNRGKTCAARWRGIVGRERERERRVVVGGGREGSAREGE